MLKADKQFLAWLIRNKPERTDKWMASECDCTVATVRRYRKALTPAQVAPS